MSRTAIAAGLSISLLLTGCSALEGGSVAGDFPSRNVEIMVPAAPGGGWDLTARQMQHVIQEDKFLPGRSISVVNVTGAGGAVGISKLVTKNRKDPHTLMITGLVMVGALTLNQSKITISDTTPIATVTAEQEVLVVKADSPLKSLKDLVDKYKADPTSVSWGGGTIGGTDHITAGTLVKTAGLDPSKVKYISYSGGGEATAAILSGDVTVGISGLSEFEEQITAGKMRVLATSGTEPMTVDGKQLPTHEVRGLRRRSPQLARDRRPTGHPGSRPATPDRVHHQGERLPRVGGDPEEAGLDRLLQDRRRRKEVHRRRNHPRTGFAEGVGHRLTSSPPQQHEDSNYYAEVVS